MKPIDERLQEEILDFLKDIAKDFCFSDDDLRDIAQALVAKIESD